MNARDSASTLRLTAKRFRNLGYLDATWNAMVGWSFSPPADTDRAHEFKSIAEGAAETAFTARSWRVWLDRLRDAGYSQFTGVVIETDLGEAPGGEIIHDVCHVSADYCGLLARAYEASQSQQASAKNARSEFPNRAAWLKEAMRKRDNMRPHRLQEVGGPDKKTIRKILDGHPVRENSLEKIVGGLNHEGRGFQLSVIKLEDIPSD